jgi:hypothetical protein
MLGEDAIHRADRADVASFVEERGEDLGWRQVDEAGLVQQIERRLAFLGRERAG